MRGRADGVGSGSFADGPRPGRRGCGEIVSATGWASTIHTAWKSKITPPAIDGEPTVRCSKTRSSSPSTIKTRATVAAVTSIFRCTRRLVAASSGAVISTNGTSASWIRYRSTTPKGVDRACKGD